MQSEKKKIRCPECSAAFMVRMDKLPKKVTELTCSKCEAKIPLMERLLPEEPKPTSGDEPAGAVVALAAATGAGDSGDWQFGMDPLSGGPLMQSSASDDEEDDGGWLAIYGDMMSLLLVFFVLLFAISSLDKHKFEMVIGSISSALGGPGQAMFQAPGNSAVPGGLSALQPLSLSQERKNEVIDEILDGMQGEQVALDRVRENLQLLVDSYELSDQFELHDEPDAMVIVARDAALFDSGSAHINPRYHNVLWEIAYTLNRQPNRVVVEGHTDDSPIASARFPSNWELSTARATAVVKLFLNKADFDPARIAASGVAYFRPRYPMQGPQGSMNRRIEIRVNKRYPAQLLQTGAR